MKKVLITVLAITTVLVVAVSVASADTDYDDGAVIEVIVGSKATGGFGPLLGGIESDPTVQEMVKAVTLEEGQSVTIYATGVIVLDTGNPEGTTVDPDGGVLGIRPGGGSIYFPLEEVLVELPPPPLQNIGALMGAFVSGGDDDDDDAGFLARNGDPNPDRENFGGVIPDPPIVGDIPAEALFLIGAGPFAFTAPEDGTLYLGINDAFTPNNDDGEFDVTITLDSDDDFDDDNQDDDDDRRRDD